MAGNASAGGCPYAQRAKIVVEEKGLPYKVELFEKDAKPQEFLATYRSATSNPNGRGTVPTIIDEWLPSPTSTFPPLPPLLNAHMTFCYRWGREAD